MYRRYTAKIAVVLFAALGWSVAFAETGGASSPPTPRCQIVIIQPRQASAYTFRARECGDLRSPPVGDIWAQIRSHHGRHINALPVPSASPGVQQP